MSEATAVVMMLRKILWTVLRPAAGAWWLSASVWSWCRKVLRRPSAHSSMWIYDPSAESQQLRHVGTPFIYMTYLKTSHCADERGWCLRDGTSRVSVRLAGRYARIENAARENAGAEQLHYQGAPVFNWNLALKIRVGDPAMRDLMAYFHTTDARLRFENLFSRATLSALDVNNWLSELPVVVDGQGEWANNAYWDGENHQLVFGENVPHVLDSLVIFHEYAHAVIGAVLQPGRFPSAYDVTTPVIERLATATSEALADYLACTVKQDPLMLRGSKNARPLNVPVVFDPASEREPHRDSLALSTALWEFREAFGARTVDELVLALLLSLSKSRWRLKTFVLTQAAYEFVTLDRKLFHGDHAAQMIQVFKNRRIWIK